MSDYNIYDIDALIMAIKRVRAFPVSVSRKADHRVKIDQVRSLLDELGQDFNLILASEHFHSSAWIAYSNAVGACYNRTTKICIDQLLWLAVESIAKELDELVNVEYQTRDGRLIKDAHGLWHDASWLKAATQIKEAGND